MPATLCSLSVDEYDRMIAAGALARGKRLELIEGELLPMSPIGPLHETAVDLLAEWSFEQVRGHDIRVRIQQSIGVTGHQSAPEPDIAWVRKSLYRSRRPQCEDVRLLIEVADTSLEYDRDVKGPLYARGGIPEYWLVNLEDSVVEVNRAPEGGGYNERQTYTVGESIAPLALPESELRVGWLFGAED